MSIPYKEYDHEQWVIPETRLVRNKEVWRIDILHGAIQVPIAPDKGKGMAEYFDQYYREEVRRDKEAHRDD